MKKIIIIHDHRFGVDVSIAVLESEEARERAARLVLECSACQYDTPDEDIEFFTKGLDIDFEPEREDESLTFYDGSRLEVRL